MLCIHCVCVYVMRCIQISTQNDTQQRLYHRRIWVRDLLSESLSVQSKRACCRSQCYFIKQQANTRVRIIHAFRFCTVSQSRSEHASNVKRCTETVCKWRTKNDFLAKWSLTSEPFGEVAVCPLVGGSGKHKVRAVAEEEKETAARKKAKPVRCV